MMRSVICEGDPTSHGGKVMEGHGPATIDGRKIARRGHLTYCPQCKGSFPIIEGVDHHTFAGVGTALDGMKTACGAELIATQQRMKIEDGISDPSSSHATSARPDAAPEAEKVVEEPAEFPLTTSTDSFSGSFRAVDLNTGTPLMGIPYRIELEDGSTVRGVTDTQGKTQHITSTAAETIRLYWEAEASVEIK
jgi:uncharacterized Zn-binding protein involved in type VI secretion